MPETIYLATDHAGFELKEKVKSYLASTYPSISVQDCGATTYDESDDYTDFIHKAGESLSADVITGKGNRAIVFGGSGEGEAMVMNRYKGVRCTTYYGGSIDIVKLGREHNDANAISFGARFLEESECLLAIDTFLKTPFSKDSRHARRIHKLDI